VVRVAFTLIELIFAIVVIGIAVISIPTMNQVSTDGMEANQLQEAIFLASAELSQAVSANWDENSYEPGDENGTAKVIDFDPANPCNNDSLSARFRLRPGHVTGAYHRSCLQNPATGLAGAPANPSVDAFEDLEGNKALAGVDADSKDAYKLNMNTTIRVIPNGGLIQFGDDVAANVNIKQLQATIVTGPDSVVLNTYSCNIGEVSYYSRSF
jgi:hypothetical protein